MTSHWQHLLQKWSLGRSLWLSVFKCLFTRLKFSQQLKTFAFAGVFFSFFFLFFSLSRFPPCCHSIRGRCRGVTPTFRPGTLKAHFASRACRQRTAQQGITSVVGMSDKEDIALLPSQFDDVQSSDACSESTNAGYHPLTTILAKVWSQIERAVLPESMPATASLPHPRPHVDSLTWEALIRTFRDKEGGRNTD